MLLRGVPVDSETLPRSVRRKFFPKKTLSSYPLLSGDTFKSLCSYNLSDDDLINFTVRKSLLAKQPLIFAGAKPLSDTVFKLAGILENEKLSLFSETILLIHNGDEIPNKKQFEILSRHFLHIYSVNYLGDSSKISPLPIGLENKSILRNGVPRDYINYLGKAVKPDSHRDIDFLFAFSIHTNPKIRFEALAYSKSLPGSFVVNSTLTPRQYRRLARRSRFVISPPGNGPDCHRTWEALYLGATPIVLNKYWPFNNFNLPVIALESWNELQSTISIPSTFGFPWYSIHAWLETPLGSLHVS
jgi:hypothetical protein